MRRFLNKFRWTGYDWLDHSINASLLWIALKLFFAWVLNDSETEVIWATSLTIGVCAVLEVSQGLFNFGNAQTSDFFSGFVPAVALMLLEWSAAISFNWYPVPGNSIGINIFVLLVVLPLVWYFMVYKQVKGGLFKK